MNRNDFLNIMEEAVPFNRQSISEFFDLVEIFPYFQSAHMLLLKGLKENDDVKFQNQLRNSAIHIADREALYYMLQKKPSSAMSDEIVPEEIKQDPEPGAENADTKSESENKDLINDSDTEQTVIESARNSEDLINEIEKESNKPETEEKADMYADQVEHSILIEAESDIEEPAGIIMLKEEEVSGDDTKVFFMDPGFSVAEEDDLLELDLDDTGKSDDETEDSGTGTIDQPLKSERQNQSDLIDKFIIANPRIEPNRDKTTLPEGDISLSSADESGFVTETLARIYIAQGYYSKAIDIFEKLSLKFPEKSSYFASQIEKVKEYLK